MKAFDLVYLNQGLFTCFVPQSNVGETAWKEIAAVNAGVAKVFTIHAKQTIAQLRKAGYSVGKAPKVSLDDFSEDDLLVELGI